MLDFVLNLLIFFIITTSFIKESGTKVTRAEAETAEYNRNGNILVAIRPNGDIWLDRKQVELKDIRATIERFHEIHREIHTDARRDEEPILQGLRLRAVGLSRKPELPRLPRARGSVSAARKGKRRAYFEGGFRTIPVYDGAALRAGHAIKGPAIVEEPFTTVVVHPGHRAEIDAWGDYRIALA